MSLIKEQEDFKSHLYETFSPGVGIHTPDSRTRIIRICLRGSTHCSSTRPGSRRLSERTLTTSMTERENPLWYRRMVIGGRNGIGR